MDEAYEELYHSCDFSDILVKECLESMSDYSLRKLFSYLSTLNSSTLRCEVLRLQVMIRNILMERRTQKQNG